MSDQIPEETLVDKLAKWILMHKITRTASNDLLKILRESGHIELPKCTRTILQTPRNVLSQEKCGGNYIYLGICRGLKRILAHNTNQLNSNTIRLSVNVDGVPLYKSSNVQTWPILCKINDFPPFIVAVFVGNSKPSDPHSFLHDFLTEYRHLSENGFEHDGHVFNVRLLAFICDAPARQFLKGIKSHNGYNACERCLENGIYEISKVVFLDINCDLRDDISFQREVYMGTHQISKSPLPEFGIKCITEFPLDYMHLVCLGVMKRMLLTWTEGPRHTKLSPSQIKHVSKDLESFRGKFPSDFARQPRGLGHVRRWKATEFRQFLLYTGFLVLKNVLPPGKYNHFLCFSLAMNVLLQEDDQIRKEFLNYAKNLLRHFVSASKEIYGRTFSVYNVHSLIHLHEDSVNFNCSLDDISCFPFENHLQTVKRYVRKTQNPLAQIVKRVTELENLALSSATHKHYLTKISTNDKDSWFMMKSGSFCQVKEINSDGTYICAIINPHHFQNVYNQPCESKKFNIVYVKNVNWKKNVLIKKCFYRKLYVYLSKKVL